MPSLESINGKLYKKYYDPVKKYTRRKSLRLKDTEANRRLAKKIIKNHNSDYVDADYINENEAILFKDALAHFLSYNNYKPKTIDVFKRAGEYLIKSSGNKIVKDYNEKDYIKLKNYFDIKNSKQNTRSIYTRALHKLFNSFIEKGYRKNNIILIIRQADGLPAPIPVKDKKAMLNELRNNDRTLEPYFFFKFLLNTGIRISTILALDWSDINSKRKIIIFRNVKIKGKLYRFPLTPVLKGLFKEMGNKKSGKVFNYKSADSLKIFYRVQDKLWKERRYHIHQCKHTFISEMAQKGVPLDDLSEITDTSYRTLKKYYAEYDLAKIAKRISKIEV